MAVFINWFWKMVFLIPNQLLLITGNDSILLESIGPFITVAMLIGTSPIQW